MLLQCHNNLQHSGWSNHENIRVQVVLLCLCFQACGECLVECFGCQSFLNALGDPVKHRYKLTLLLEKFADSIATMEKIDEDDLAAGKDALSEVAPHCCAAYRRIKMVVHGLLGMLSLVPQNKGCTAADANKLKSYSGKDLLECSCRDILKSTKAWQALFDDLVSKGSSSITMAPELAELTELLEKTEPDQLDADLLSRCATRVPYLKKQMRQGSVSGLEKLLYKKAIMMAQEINKLDGLSLSVLDALHSVVSLFRETQGVLQLLSRLDSFRKDKMGSLSTAEVELQLKKYPATSEEDVPCDLWPVLQKLLGGLRMMESLDENLAEGLQRCVWWHLRILHGVLEAFGFC